MKIYSPLKRYAARLREIFPQIPSITVAKRADSLFPIVSAASIVAKVSRDFLLESHVFPEVTSPGSWRPSELSSRQRERGLRFGSGYPGDAQTVDWLEKNLDVVFGFPDLVRFGWETTIKLLEKHCVDVEFYEEVEDVGSNSNATDSGAGGLGLAANTGRGGPVLAKRGKAFNSRGLSSVVEW